MKSKDQLKALQKRIAQLENENAALKEMLESRENSNDQSGLSGEAFRENAIKLKTIFENSNDGIILINSDGVILDWNSRIAKVTGLPREQAVNRYVWDIQFSFVPHDQKRAISVDFLKLAWEKEVLSQPVDHTVSGFGEIVSRTGKEEFIEDFVKPVMIENKRYYIVFQSYITQQKKTEQLLMEAEEKFRKIFDQSPSPIIFTRIKNFILTDVNKAFEELTGFKKDEIAGRPLTLQRFFIEEQEGLDLTGIISNALENESYPIRIRNKEGAIIDLFCKFSILRVLEEDYCLSIFCNISNLEPALK